jgi:hypothetical protein
MPCSGNDRHPENRFRGFGKLYKICAKEERMKGVGSVKKVLNGLSIQVHNFSRWEAVKPRR